MKNNFPTDLFPFGFQQMPGGHPGQPGGDLMTNLMYSMGQQGVFNDQGYQSIYQNMMNQNLQNGLPAFTGFPKGFGDTNNDANGDGEADNGEDQKPNKLKGMPQWYQDWYYSSGRLGGVPRGKGLLDV